MAPKEQEEGPKDLSCGSRRTGLMMKIKKFKASEVFTWQLAKTLAMGQGLAGLVCGTAITSQYLASDFHVEAPMLQSFMNYALLCASYTTSLLCRAGDTNLLQILRQRWWRYLLLGLVDVEANYAVVKAYQYTTLTSIQLLDSFVIPVLIILSWWILKTRYRPVHYAAVCICLLGVGAMVGADLLAGRDQGSTSNLLLGDGLVLFSASLYAVSNVCQEYTVKNLSREEFLGMVGLFGTVISAIQMVVLERHEVASVQWSWQVGEYFSCSGTFCLCCAWLLMACLLSGLLFSGYALCMYALYSIMPLVVKVSSAASVNLSMLTADLFSLFCGIFLFQYNFSGLYLVSLAVILIGFITFNMVPTPTRQSEHASSSSSGCNEAYDNPTAMYDEATNQDVAVSITTEDGEQEKGKKSSTKM
ncbi:solute carrier family 35 member F2-like isoform X1 [Betta splendens]|uniref:Solute carrier family 35 member F2-like isoform X1 n=1 Tax=Betta splendens TaxID=158456 RepID=A0A9W2Y7V5_BETSP|nr:solute carrier family 35 member F2-like isoform X1 [Betta splendens]